MSEMSINESIKYINENLINLNYRITYNIDRDSNILVINQISDGILINKKIDEKFITFDSECFKLENLELQIGYKKINSLSEFTETTQNNDEEFKCSLIFSQKYELPFKDGIEFYLLDKQDYTELFDEVIENLKISDFSRLTNKICIINSKISDDKSSIFNFSIDSRTCKLSSTTKNMLNNPRLFNRSIMAIPRFINNIQINLDSKKKYFLECISILFDFRDDKELQIYKKNLKRISIEEMSVNFFSSYKAICSIIEFIFEEEKYVLEKLSITKNIIYEVLVEDNDNFTEEKWDLIFKELNNQYSLFVDEKVTIFIKEKKEIIKEQFNLSNQIINQIIEIKKSLVTNLMTIIGIFLSKFFIDSLNKNDIFFSKFAIYLATLFSFYLIFMFFISGEYKVHDKYEKRIEIMNEYYPKLYLTKDNILDELEEKVSNPEIKSLKRIKNVCGSIYLLLFILLLILSLLESGALITQF